MPAPLATIGDFPIIGHAAWSLTFGAAPHTATFMLTAEDAAALLAAHAADRRYTLRLASAENGTLLSVQVKNLILAGEVASNNPYLRALQFADHRWLWSFNRVLRRYNIRRGTGDRRILDAGGPIQVQPFVEDLTYWPWSMRDGVTPWTARECVGDIFAEVLPPWVKVTFASVPFDDLPVQDLEIDDNGQQAIARVLPFMTARDLYLDLNGNVRVEVRLPGAAAAGNIMTRIVATFAPLAQQGWPRWCDLSAARPRSIKVGFTREIEVRFDALEGAPPTRATDGRYMENVLPTTDPTTTINARSVGMGSWVRVDDVLPVWGTPDAISPPITHAIIRRHWFNSFLMLLYVMGTGGAGIEPSLQWSRRISAVLTHYRQTWRINRRWAERALTIRPVRVALIDPETGTFAPTIPAVDHCIRPTLRQLGRQVVDPDKARLGWNHSAFPGIDDAVAAPPWTDSRPAPARVSMLHPQQGIVRFDFVRDPFDQGVEIVPCQVSDLPAFLPTADEALWSHARLADNYRAAIILSMVPGGPNNDGNLHWVEVSRATIEAKLRRSIGSAFAPVWERRIGAGVRTARFAWYDGAAQQIEQVFGIGVPAGAAVPANIDDLMTNPEEVKSLAESEATALMAMLGNHWRGNATIPLDSAIMPVGEISRVTHSVTEQGALVTQVIADTPPATLNAFTLLPPGVRRVLMRLVDV